MGIFLRCELFLIPDPINPCYDTNWEEWSIPSLRVLIVNQCQYHPIIGTLDLNIIIKVVHIWDTRQVQRLNTAVQWFVYCATSYEIY